jgi:hypothetical protein
MPSAAVVGVGVAHLARPDVQVVVVATRWLHQPFADELAVVEPDDLDPTVGAGSWPTALAVPPIS